MAVVVKPRTCRECGAVFDGGPRAWYCPACRLARQREADARRRAKGRKADRPLGSTDKCVVCGKEYVVNSARQKYCPECAYDAVREVDRPASRAWNREHKDTYYPAKNEKRRKERAENPELVRAKDRERYRRKKSGDSI
jgi:predicted Zn-ribbon and HTH transcriptional regulator